MIRKILIVFSVVLSCCGAAQAQGVDAETLYRQYQSRIYQIRVIDIVSNKKSSIGSGFQIDGAGLIATNYHVISEYVHAPDKYRVEYLDHNGNEAELLIRDFDVIHDLAIVQAKSLPSEHISLSSKPLSKGVQIFSLGNPRDLGMTIIDGTFNGLLEKSLYEKILFSGALNPGMSGGPALNNKGEVIGVNVSTAGNDLSFLVPVKYLADLLERVVDSKTPIDFVNRIQDQLDINQQQYIKDIMSDEWETTTLGDAIVPAEIVSYFKCWGKTDDDEERLYDHTYSACSSPGSLYLSSQFETGSIDFRYDWYHSKGLNRFQFYHLIANKFSSSYSTNKAGKEDVTNYECNTDFVEIHERTWKVAMCFREYKKFRGLYDLSLTMALNDQNDKALVVNMSAAGMKKSSAMQFARKFMEEIRWQI